MDSVSTKIAFDSALQGEIAHDAELSYEFGGKGGTCFEWLRMKSLDEVEDGWEYLLCYYVRS